MKKLLMIAPGHDEFDQRVLRSFKVFSRLCKDCLLLLEESRVSKKFKNTKEIQNYSDIEVLDLFFFRKSVLKNHLFSKVDESNTIYIHDSGLYGILFIRFLNKFYPSKKIIFDYHDYLDWECLHHISKIKLPQPLNIVLFKVFMKLFDWFILSKLDIKHLIGISSGQTDQILKKLNYENSIQTSSFPNTRDLEVFKNSRNLETNKNYFLWVGNIGRNRSVEKIFNLKEKYNNQFPKSHLDAIFAGKVWGNHDFDEENLQILGSFKTVNDIFTMLPKGRIIGLFFGWQDELNLGINQISSPNKVYSYINMKLPFLIPKTLTHIIQLGRIDECFCYSNDEDFIRKTKYIFSNYNECIEKVKSIKDRIEWNSGLQKRMLETYRIILNQD